MAGLIVRGGGWWSLPGRRRLVQGHHALGLLHARGIIVKEAAGQ
jgi:hypothetical protein